MSANQAASPHDHAHAHHHGHAHSRAHDHAHDSGHAEAPRRARPGLSLLRMSAAQRLAGACGALALLWAGVFWALT